jgi:DNA (cytosine-5)-methyltransferase 1
MFRHASLFSGIGGFDLAAEWIRWENVFHCEINPFCQTVLKYYWPNAKSYEDIKQTDFSIHRGKIDILTGGFPCQPYSLAGKRKGKDDERHLWPQMLRAIREIQPRWIVGENVFGIVNWSDGMVFEEVQVDLEAEGYQVQPYILPACAVDAPHRRDRVWFVAYKDPNGKKHGRQSSARCKRRYLVSTSRNGLFINAFANSNVCRNNNPQKSKRSFWQQSNTLKSGSRGELQIGRFISKQFAPDPKSQQGEWLQFKQRKFSQQKQRESRGGNCKIITSYSYSGRQSSKEYGKKKSGFFAKESIPANWKNFPTQSPICSGNDGIPSRLVGITVPKHRNESIKGYGNAIVPQVVLQIFKAIEEYESKHRINRGGNKRD